MRNTLMLFLLICVPLLAPVAIPTTALSADESQTEEAVVPSDADVTEVDATETIATDVDTSEPTEIDPEGISTGEAFLRKLAEGGLTMVWLGLLSVFGLGCALERLMHLRRESFAPDGLAEEADALWRSGERAELEDLLRRRPSILTDMIAHALCHPDRTAAERQEQVAEVAARDLRRHMQRAYPLAVVATISPLLGLLGTVIGMIGAFDTVAAMGSMGDASMLGGDISMALITTAGGLVVAVPSLALYHFCKSRTISLGLHLEEVASDLFASWRTVPAPAPVDPIAPKQPEAAPVATTEA